MQDLLRKNSDPKTVHSMAPCIGGSLSWWTAAGLQMPQSGLTRNLSFKMTTPVECSQSTKQLGFHFQDQESSSTQSTGQSYQEVASVETKKYGINVLPIQSDVCFSASLGCSGTHGKPEEDQSKSTISFQDYVLPHSPIDYQQYARFHFPCPDPYHCGLLTAYGPYLVVNSPMMGMTPTRVPLPLDAPQDEPIYVNAKQYRAILRRRQFRAKLETQNKLSKVRKPYLHESRHHHALNRARGSGGRFLNTKKLQEPKVSSKTNDQDISDSMQLQLSTEAMESEVHQPVNEKEGNSMTSCSEITSASNSDNNIFHPQEFRFSLYRSHTGGTLAASGGGTTGGLQQCLSVLR